ncbi:hypothetical protein K2X92_01830 [Candidatus Gracilibacteria bacterium]|nr:hypothetical protein [Candidatus Gracilibacteria bacterium]
MQKIIIQTSLIIPIIGMQVLSAFALALPATPPVTSTTGVNGIFTQFFENISTAPLATNINPIIIGFNSPSLATPMTPIYLTDSQFVTNYLKTAGLPSGDKVVNGFDASGNIIFGSMDVLVKSFLGTTYGAIPLKHGIRGFDASGNAITSQDIGYWNAVLPNGIQYPGGTVIVNGNIRLFGNATTHDASSANHLVTYGQVQNQITSIENAIP